MIAFFGGTFDPVHAGHIHAARSVCDALDLTTLHLVLSAHPPHRPSPVASVEQRLAMLQIAADADSRLVVNDCEAKRSEPSYTVNTVELLAQTSGAPVNWVVGSDSFATLTEWHRWEALWALANFIVLARPGEVAMPAELASVVAGRQVDQLSAREPGKVMFLPVRMLPISATQVRAGIARQDPEAGNLLPSGVSAYITEHELYGPSGPRKRDTAGIGRKNGGC